MRIEALVFMCRECGFSWISNKITRCHGCGSANILIRPLLGEDIEVNI